MDWKDESQIVKTQAELVTLHAEGMDWKAPLRANISSVSVILYAEGVDWNLKVQCPRLYRCVTLHAEGVDWNPLDVDFFQDDKTLPSWQIEIWM